MGGGRTGFRATGGRKMVAVEAVTPHTFPVERLLPRKFQPK